jgi:ribose transport system permease protein
MTGRAGARGALLLALRHAPVILLAVVLLVFGAMSPRFLRPGNLMDIVVQSASVGIVATGMTVVLLTGGIDLSVGSAMFVAAAVAGKLLLRDEPAPLWVVFLAMVLVGLVFGAVNAVAVTWLKLLPFVVTLATLYIGRGFALWMTETRAMNVFEFVTVGSSRFLGVPFPVLVFAAVVAAAHVLLTYTPFGRQLYALGHDAEAAKKAGISRAKILTACYVISGLCAGVAAIVTLGQLGAVSPKFGLQVEFDAIAAAVLGGTSLFGGRGKVFPGTVVGAVLIRAVFSGLVTVQADPYVYPLVTSGIVFLAVLIDVGRGAALKRLTGRREGGSGSAVVQAP